MKKIFFLAFLPVVFASCMLKKGSGNIVKETRNIESFTGLSVGGGFTVEISNGATQNVVVEADDNLMKYVEMNVSGGELKVKLAHVSVTDAHLKLLITVPEINRIAASAGCVVVSKTELKSASAMKLAASAGSDIKVNLDAPEVSADASSGSEINISGRTKTFRAESSSGSTLSASDLLSETTEAKASSGASAHVYASVKLDAKASSGGDIVYKGGAASVIKEENSGGSVHKSD
ncbi:MAG: DUF2807 domain-containing protein [Bacteroidetes bacterium]|nr:DUF2807 domain-containing protein [Bacteroidota bacterium]